MPSVDQVEMQVRSALLVFLESIGREAPVIEEATDLARGLELESDQGLDFVLDLETALGASLPVDFNPIVHSSGKRGMRFGELVTCVHGFLSQQGDGA